MEIYVKPKKRVSLAGVSHVYVGDVGEVYAPKEIRERVLRVKLLDTGEDKKRLFLVSALDVIEAVDKALPGHTISNLGEMDTVVEYKRSAKRDNALWKWTKIVFLTLVFAVGAGTAIMSFHNDAEIPKVFKAYYKMFTGKESGEPRSMQVAYSIGLAAGIIVFFNHFGGKKVTDAPSPIEVEMVEYDDMVTDAAISFLDAKKTAEKGGGRHGGD